MKAPKHWKKLQRHQLSAEYQDIEGRQWDIFLENVNAYGVINRRTITLHEGKVIDGWQLQRACVALNVTPNYEILKLKKGMTIDEFKLISNDLRRHEPAASVSKRIEERRHRVMDAHAAGESNVVIAKNEGISEKTVRKDLKNSGSGSDGSEPEKVKGQDGKTYPAKKKPTLCERCQRVGAAKDCPKCKEAKAAKRKPKAAAPIATDDDASDADEQVVLDPAGTLVPEKCRPAFAAQSAFDEAGKLIDQVQSIITTTIKGDAGHYLKQRIAHFETACGNLKSQFIAGKPSHVCPYCETGKADCTCCNGCGWVPKHTYATSPKGAK